jgi:uncharacterized membrane protein YphA (DoxX/SURF4 family)
MKKYLTLNFILKLVVAVILIQTLYFKFTGAPESKYIFETVGMEPWGRIGTGFVELFAAVLILIPFTSWLGAILALGVVSGAIFFHLTKLGIVVMDDGGLLFALACTVFLFSLVVLWQERRHIPIVNKFFARDVVLQKN